ncbi:S41 family peptidase [Desulfopila sp. IMCC35006]|uniref:S41 family peptidase n=1 Tax=Desulfopila sp. IMCC35006 TaxID=2569542 RepID=UPI001F0F6163|nr:S41 family peptidase [Desulfopila sp. IMCC35006]
MSFSNCMSRRSAYSLAILLFFLCTPVLAENADDAKTATYKQLEIFSNVLSILQENYVEEIDTKEVINGAIRGLLFSLDPHSSYMPPDSFKDLQEETRGSFSGIGIEVTIKNDLLTVVSPIADTPADLAGLKANDTIIEIDGVNTKNMGPDEAIKKLRGPAGSSVTLSIHREGWDKLKVITLKREIIPIQSVKAEFLSPGFVYTRITNFQSHTTADFKEKLQVLQKKHQIDGLILDLRNNPGGLLNQAISIADIFLNKGTIVYTKGRREDQNNIYTAHDNGEKRMYPLVLLVNEGSASASEIVAGAIQAHKRGIIVGTRTFGKGSVQTIIPLPDGAGMRITTAKYYTPDNRSIQALGITPDVEIPFIACGPSADSAESTKLLKEEDLAHHLPGAPAARGVDQEKTARQLEARLQTDNQLRTAYNIIKSLTLYYDFNKTVK